MAEHLSTNFKLSRVIGWYHSHPQFIHLPSTIDLNCQFQYQQMDRGFVGLIISLFNHEKRELNHQHVSMRNFIDDNDNNNSSSRIGSIKLHAFQSRRAFRRPFIAGVSAAGHFNHHRDDEIDPNRLLTITTPPTTTTTTGNTTPPTTTNTLHSFMPSFMTNMDNSMMLQAVSIPIEIIDDEMLKSEMIEFSHHSSKSIVGHSGHGDIDGHSGGGGGGGDNSDPTTQQDPPFHSSSILYWPRNSLQRIIQIQEAIIDEERDEFNRALSSHQISSSTTTPPTTNSSNNNNNNKLFTNFMYNSSIYQANLVNLIENCLNPLRESLMNELERNLNEIHQLQDQKQ